MTGLARASPAVQGATSVTRRSMLHHVGVGAASVVDLGIGVGGYRVADNGVLDAGESNRHHPNG